MPSVKNTKYTAAVPDRELESKQEQHNWYFVK